MNLKEFNNYRKLCPICDTPLVTGFHSNKQQSIRYEGNSMKVMFFLHPLTKHQKRYRVAYHFNIVDHSFSIEFYMPDGSARFESIPDFLRLRFLEFHKNLKEFKFFRGCTFCLQYAYTTKFFKIDLKQVICEPLEVWSEEVGLVHPLADGHRIYRMYNMYGDKKSTILVWNGVPSEAAINLGYSPKRVSRMDLPLIPFVSKEETINRLNNLIVFS